MGVGLIVLELVYFIVREKDMKQILKIFLVEDYVLFREILTARLEELEGVQVVGQAATVAEAIDGLREMQPDVLTLDLRLPDGSGLEVLLAVKQSETPPLVIVLTQYANPHYRTVCLEAGADYFFDKSSEFEQVVQVIAELYHYRLDGNI
jgi:DNA-binding NarL/FixJ family response regulator